MPVQHITFASLQCKGRGPQPPVSRRRVGGRWSGPASPCARPMALGRRGTPGAAPQPVWCNRGRLWSLSVMWSQTQPRLSRSPRRWGAFPAAPGSGFAAVRGTWCRADCTGTCARLPAACPDPWHV